MARRALTNLALVAGIVGGGTLLGRRLGYRMGTNQVVRCREGHLFTTVWLPGATFKSLDLGIARVQRCPVGNHWSLVVPVKDGTLSTEEAFAAAAHHDLRIP